MKKSPILYFFPGSAEIPRDIPEIASRFSPKCLISMATGLVRIPGDGIPPGTLASPFGGVFVNSSDASYRWHEYVPGRVWIGVLRDLNPEMVRRENVPRTITGRGCLMADGNTWYIPVANPLSQNLGLPSCSVPVIDDYGKTVWKKRVVDQYAELSAKAESIAASLRSAVIDGTGTISIDDSVIRDILGEALGLFYDVSLAEIAVIGLVNPDDCMQAIHILTDWPAMEQDFRRAIAEVAEGQPPFGG